MKVGVVVHAKTYQKIYHTLIIVSAVKQKIHSIIEMIQLTHVVNYVAALRIALIHALNYVIQVCRTFKIFTIFFRKT